MLSAHLIYINGNLNYHFLSQSLHRIIVNTPVSRLILMRLYISDYLNHLMFNLRLVSMS